MKVRSFISDHNKLVPIEVELTLWPGLPTIQFLGLPDQHLRESVLRIKSAIKSQGFAFPKSQQILVNLRPSHLKKTSRGLELAVAAAYLWETGQVQMPLPSDDFYVYGELSLSGEVYEPEDLPSNIASTTTVLTGSRERAKEQNFVRQALRTLKEIENPQNILATAMVNFEFERPQFPDLWFSKEQANLLAVVALGEHSCLMAGPSGSGKTTLAKALHPLLRKPKKDQWVEVFETQKKFGIEIRYPPLVKPHHTTPVISMVGGGSIPMAGEISRAHGGLLLLDEFLEFKLSIQEALREPLEEGLIRVARAGKMETFPARSLCVATTNLCPCGDFIPGLGQKLECRYSRTKCTSYKERLSGPIMDRFHILFFTQLGQAKEISLGRIFERVEKAREYQQQPAAWRDIHEIEKTLSEFWQKRRLEMFTSERRKNALLKVARTLADLEQSPTINKSCWSQAYNLSITPFDKIKKWDL